MPSYQEQRICRRCGLGSGRSGCVIASECKTRIEIHGSETVCGLGGHAWNKGRNVANTYISVKRIHPNKQNILLTLSRAAFSLGLGVALNIQNQRLPLVGRQKYRIEIANRGRRAETEFGRLANIVRTSEYEFNQRFANNGAEQKRTGMGILPSGPPPSSISLPSQTQPSGAMAAYT